MAVEGRSIIIKGTKEDMKAIAAFANAVAKHLESAEDCHMHLQDHMPGWKKGDHIDIEMNVES